MEDEPEMASDPAKRRRILTMKINQGIKFGTLKKPMFSFFGVIIFYLMGK